MLTNIGLIGYGGFGEFLLESWQKIPDVRVVSVADINPARNPGENIKFYQSWEDLIKFKNVDIIWISTPPDTHAKIACAAMNEGMDVVIEKPIAINLDDANRILKTRDQTSRIATIDYMLRFNPICRCFADFTSNEIFGRFRRANIENYAQDQSLPPQHWFWNKELSGGILIEHAVHFIDLINYFSSRQYRTVNALSHKRSTGQEDQVFTSVLYDNGLIASHYHSFSRPRFFEQTSIRLNYDLADIDIHGWIPLSGNFRALVNEISLVALHQLPGLKIEKDTGISDLIGASPQQKLHILQSGGTEYEVERMVEGTFKIDKDKSQVYADCVCALLQDVITRRQNPAHKLMVTLEDGLSSLKIASLASDITNI